MPPDPHGLLRGSGVAPWPTPDQPELRQTRFREVADGMIERWVWEPDGMSWRLDSTRSRAEPDAGADRVLEARRELEPWEEGHAQALAREMGW